MSGTKLRSALREPIERFKEWLAKSLGISTDTLACGERKLVCATLGKGGKEVSVRLLLQKDKASMPLARFLRTVKTDCKNKKSNDLEQKKQKAMRLGKELITKPQAPQATGQGGRRARPQATAATPSSKRWPKSILQQLASTLEDLLQGCCAQTTGKGSCFVKGTLVDIGHGQKPLGPWWIAGTTRVLTHTANEGGTLHPEQGPPQDHEDRRLIYLVVRAGQPDEVFLTLLRPLQWLKDYRVSEGAIIPLDLPEMAVEGDAFVLKVAPCPTTVEGEGSLVTGTFAHKNGNVLSLKVASEREPLGVTASHWFWSIDRQQWVPAGMLQKGEKLLAKERVTRVEAIEEKEERVPVYNIEVEGEHVYRVGHSGVLVHNASFLPEDGGCPWGDNEPCKNLPKAELEAYRQGHTGATRTGHPHKRRNDLDEGVTYFQNTEVIALLNQDQSRGEDPPPKVQRFVNCRYYLPNAPQQRLRTGNAAPIGDGNDVVGHIISNVFGGKATLESQNFFPQNKEGNRKGNWGTLETRWDRTTKDRKGRVCVRIKFTEWDADAPLRPTKLVIEWWLNGELQGLKRKSPPGPVTYENQRNPHGFLDDIARYVPLKVCKQDNQS